MLYRYRPLAPSVLNEHAADWFNDMLIAENVSPYMSITTKIKDEKCSLIPAVCHIDQTARLQTVKKENNSLYHKLIQKFYQLSKIPMILNTSFNLKNSPIVETPEDAIKSFMAANGLLSTLYMGNFEINLRPFPFSNLQSFDKSNKIKNVGNILENELNIVVRAKKFYMCEMVSSIRSGGAENVPLRIRIQGIFDFFIFNIFFQIF